MFIDGTVKLAQSPSRQRIITDNKQLTAVHASLTTDRFRPARPTPKAS